MNQESDFALHQHKSQAYLPHVQATFSADQRDEEAT